MFVYVASHGETQCYRMAVSIALLCQSKAHVSATGRQAVLIQRDQSSPGCAESNELSLPETQGSLG